MPSGVSEVKLEQAADRVVWMVLLQWSCSQNDKNAYEQVPVYVLTFLVRGKKRLLLIKRDFTVFVCLV